MGIQTERPIEVLTPLPPDELLFLRMSAHEHLGRPFEYHLELSSKNGAISPDKLLGQGMTVRLDLPDDQVRYFNGIVTRFAQVFRSDDESRYQATLRPWIWLLTRSADCRIFPPDLSAVDIIKQVFRDHGFSHFDDKLDPKKYHKWDYCVQYRETAFNFVSRLMEQEGMYYYHVHEKDKHTLVLADSYSSHKATKGYEEVPFFTPAEGAVRNRDHLYNWSPSYEIQTGSYALNDFDFEKPGAKLLVRREVSQSHSHSNLEFFDYPGEYVQTGDGETYVSHRIEELQAQHEMIRASGNARGLTLGGLFTLTDYPRADQLKEYLIVSANYQMENDSYRSGGGSGATYSLDLQAMDAQRPFRAARITPKPVVQGPQTAIVVGKSGEEIWTDKYGRVKVKFHWDRHGKSDETASCWVRVAQIWAGKNWGAMHIPRMGQEVIVEFLEGDPDRPIITGRVYNGDQMPPYGLPDKQNISGLKSNSTKGGSATENFNEIFFDDTKDAEVFSMHAEKDQKNTVENDQAIAVGNNRTEEIKKNRTLTVGGNKGETVSGNKNVSISGDHSESIKGGMTLNVTKNRQMKVDGDLSETIKGQVQVTITKDLTQKIDGQVTVNIKKDSTISIDGASDLSVKGNIGIASKGEGALTAEKGLTINAKTITLNADDSVLFKTGSAEMKLESGGDITLKGNKITIDASSDLILKGSSIKAN